MPRYRMQTFAAVGCVLIVAAAVLVASGARLTFSTIVPIIIILSMFALQLFYITVRPYPVFATLLGSIAATITGLWAVNVISLASLQLQMPLIDMLLARADQMLGFDAASASAYLSQNREFVFLLSIAYQSSIPLVLATLIGLSLIRNYDGAWRFSFNIVISAFACALVALIAPAIGAFVTLEVPRDVIERLPIAGNYHLQAFQAFYSDEPRAIDIVYLHGVITFPSFHAAMAVLTAFSWGRNAWVSIVAWVWSAIVIVSTIPIGGHYVIDIIFGVILSLLVMLVTRFQAKAKRVDVNSRKIGWIRAAAARTIV